MPPISKHSAVLAALPSACKALAALRAAGQTDLATDLKTVVDYAKEQAERGVSKSIRDYSDNPNRALRVTTTFRDHVYAQVAAEAAEHEDEPGPRLRDIITGSLEDFLNGDWTPPKPARSPRGAGVKKVPLNVRVPADVWDRANTQAKDRAARGYRLTAESIAIAALEERFGVPEDATTPA